MAIKKIGQNFLINQVVAQREIQYAGLDKNDVVLEIGPGKGILTNKIAEKAKQVIAVEIDKKLVHELRKIVPDNVQIINKDILKIELDSLPKFNKIVANLPFHISSPLTFKLLNYPFTKAVLIYQKDFAERMIANKGTKKYSRLSVGIYCKSKCKILEIVPKNNFIPIPKVDSAVVEIIPRKEPPFKVNDDNYFYNLVKQLFNYRRKKIKKILGIDSKNHPHIFNLDKRVEELSPEQIGELCNYLLEIEYKF